MVFVFLFLTYSTKSILDYFSSRWGEKGTYTKLLYDKENFKCALNTQCYVFFKFYLTTLCIFHFKSQSRAKETVV